MPPGFSRQGIGDSERLPNLVQAVLQGAVSNRELRQALPHIWDEAEVPCLQQPQVVIFALFKRTGFISDREDVTEPPPEGLSVWRGAHPDRAKGLAWFTARDEAAWFADPENARQQLERARSQGIVRVPEAVGEPKPPKLYQSHAPPAAILGLFGQGRKREVIVDPNELRRFRTVTD